jgi:hypothetical protein
VKWLLRLFKKRKALTRDERIRRAVAIGELCLFPEMDWFRALSPAEQHLAMDRVLVATLGPDRFPKCEGDGHRLLAALMKEATP